MKQILNAFALLLLFLAPAQAQQLEKDISDNRKYGLKMLKDVKAAIKASETREVEVQTRVQKIIIRIESSWIDMKSYSPDVEDDLGPGPHYAEIGPDLIVCRLPSFEMETSEIDKMMKRISGHGALILDLRSNPGGLVTAGGLPATSLITTSRSQTSRGAKKPKRCEARQERPTTSPANSLSWLIVTRPQRPKCSLAWRK